ncbi:MAG: SPOR domain-containing protein [Arenibacterium sp.]
MSACAEGPDFAFLQPKEKAETVDTQEAGPSTTPLVERDVESPDVFSAKEAGLWDGRPSLGGVWVAHPDVAEPERVVIRNNTNGKEVIGALFRRERDIPGPRLQASSDAAVALGMLAGAPVELNVVALRREAVQQEATPEPEATQVAEAVPAAEAVEETSLDPIAGAAAAIEASEERPQAEVAAIAEEAPAPEQNDVDAAVAEAVVPSQKKQRKSWFGAGLFANNRNKDVGAPLSALKPEEERVASASPVAVATDAAPAPRPEPRRSKLDKPFIQIGIFSVEDNAERAAGQMRSAGMVPTVYAQSSNGKKFWRVVVGPAQTKSERSKLIKQIQGVGFSDAYAVTN